MVFILIWIFTTLSGRIPTRYHQWSILYLFPTPSHCKPQSLTCCHMITTLSSFFDSLLEILRGEARVLEGLHNLGVKGEHQYTLLRLPVNHVADSYALDIRHPAIMVRCGDSPVLDYTAGNNRESIICQEIVLN